MEVSTGSTLTLDACVLPDWRAPARVRALVTTRHGGVSRAPYDALNLGLHTGDEREDVLANRRALGALAGHARFAWLEQVHANTVVDAARVADALDAGESPPRADASLTDEPGVACVVMVADCMPVLFCDEHGRAVGAAHAGWRGLAAGVLERTAEAVARKAGPGARVHAYLGPAIGPDAFEVGRDVFDAFVESATASEKDATAGAFSQCVSRDGSRPLSQHASSDAPAHASAKYLANIAALARVRLARAGVVAMTGGDLCTMSDPQRFYSFRRDKVTGRFAGVIWLDGD